MKISINDDDMYLSIVQHLSIRATKMHNLVVHASHHTSSDHFSERKSSEDSITEPDAYIHPIFSSPSHMFKVIRYRWDYVHEKINGTLPWCVSQCQYSSASFRSSQIHVWWSKTTVFRRSTLQYRKVSVRLTLSDIPFLLIPGHEDVDDA